MEEELAEAASNGDIATVRRLLDQGVDVQCFENRPLIWAAEGGQTEVVELLLDRGADIHIMNDLPLQFAIKYDHLETVRLLVDRGSVITWFSFYSAILHCYTDIVKLAIERGFDIRNITEFSLSRTQDNERCQEMILFLLSKGLNIKLLSPDRQEKTRRLQMTITPEQYRQLSDIVRIDIVPGGSWILTVSGQNYFLPA
jgi:ankyrin repeat protein